MAGVWRADLVEGNRIGFRRGSALRLYDLKAESCHEIRRLADRAGEELIIGKKLADWYRAATAKPAPPAVDSFELQNLPLLAEEYPHAWAAISQRPFQTVGALFAARNGEALIADEPGLGKTLQTIAAMVEGKVTGPILVVASPKSAAFLTWPQEIKRWAPNDEVLLIGPHIPAKDRGKAVIDAVTSCDSADGRVWVLCAPNYVRLRPDLDDRGNYVYENGIKKITPVREAIGELFRVSWGAIVVDEAHRTLAGATGNKKKQSAQRYGLGALELAPGGLKIALSGTPARGKEQNLWGILNWLRPDEYRSYWKWVERHFDVLQDPYGTIIGEMKNRERFYAELKEIMVRRTKQEVAPELPAKQYAGVPLRGWDADGNPDGPVGVWLDMLPAQAKAYKQMQKHASASLEGGDVMANGVLAILTRLKQFACSYGYLGAENQMFRPGLPSNKFEWLLDFLEERGITGQNESISASKVIVASQFTKLLNLFRDELNSRGIKTHILTGETPDSERVRMMEEFQAEGGTNVFLLNMIAGGASITLDAADDVVILDPPWNRDDQEQVEDRAHRISRTDHNVTIHQLYSRGTLEESIAELTQGKQRNIKSLLDGQRGVEFAIKLIEGNI